MQLKDMVMDLVRVCFGIWPNMDKLGGVTGWRIRVKHWETLVADLVPHVPADPSMQKAKNTRGLIEGGGGSYISGNSIILIVGMMAELKSEPQPPSFTTKSFKEGLRTMDVFKSCLGGGGLTK